MTSAKEFIKQYGWSKSDTIVFESIGHGANTFYDTHDELYYGQINDIRVSVTELKQYVDALALVEKHGGLKEAKDLSISQVGLSKHFLELKKAIELVESVNEHTVDN